VRFTAWSASREPLVLVPRLSADDPLVRASNAVALAGVGGVLEFLERSSKMRG
jgi:hypothetical protein